MALKDETSKVLKKNKAVLLKDGSNALPEDFNEDLYLQARPDVAKAIQSGSLGSGAEHWQMQGFQEDNSGYNKLKSDMSAALSKQNLMTSAKNGVNPITGASMPIDYTAKAKSIYDPMYNTNVTNVKNEAETAIQNYDNQIGGIKASYADQSKNARTNTSMTKNNATRRALSSGLIRSVNSNANLDSIDIQGEQLQERIGQARTNDLNNIENMKAVIRNNLASKLNAMQSDYQTGLTKTATDLEDRDYQRSLSEAGLTGMYKGQQTMQGKLNDINLTGGQMDNQMKELQVKELSDPNSVTNQMKQLGLDKAKIDYAILDKTYESQIQLILDQVKRGTIDLRTAEIQLNNLPEQIRLQNEATKASMTNAAESKKAATERAIAEAETKATEMAVKKEESDFDKFYTRFKENKKDGIKTDDEIQEEIFSMAFSSDPQRNREYQAKLLNLLGIQYKSPGSYRPGATGAYNNSELQ